MKSGGLTRLSIRFLTADLARNLILAVVLGCAVTIAALSWAVGEAITSSMNSEVERLYGTARVTLPAEGRALVGGGGWFTSEDLALVSRTLEVEGVRVAPRIEADVLLVTGSESAPATLLSTNTRLSTYGTAQPAESDARLVLPVVETGPETSARAVFVELGESARWNRDARDPGVVRVAHDDLVAALRSEGVAGSNDVANVLVIERDDNRSPSVIAFNSEELLESEFPAVRVRGRDDLAGVSSRYSALNLAFLARLLIILTAAAAATAVVLVNAESREDEFLLLHATGYGLPALRAIAVRGVLFTSLVATAVGLVVAAAVAGLAPGLSAGSVRYGAVAFAGAFGPAGLTFLVIRSSLAHKLPGRSPGRPPGRAAGAGR